MHLHLRIGIIGAKSAQVAPRRVLTAAGSLASRKATEETAGGTASCRLTCSGSWRGRALTQGLLALKAWISRRL